MVSQWFEQLDLPPCRTAKSRPAAVIRAGSAAGGWRTVEKISRDVNNNCKQILFENNKFLEPTARIFSCDLQKTSVVILKWNEPGSNQNSSD